MSFSAPASSRYAPVALLAVTLLVFAGVVTYGGLWLRGSLQRQILQREAEVLKEVASLQLRNEADAMAAVGVADASSELLNAVLKTSKLRGVFAVRVFDAQRQFIGAVPFDWADTPPPGEYWNTLDAGVPVVRLHKRESAAEVIGLAPSVEGEHAGEPLIETWFPLRHADGGPLLGIAQMWTDGHAIATEFRAVDRRLARQALAAWLGGALIIGLVLNWAFNRLGEANRQLQRRSDDLLRANRELTLAAKTSAIGAITAHLMHQLKNPVAGLEEYVAGQVATGGRETAGGELEAATHLTRRLRMMINDVASVMRDEQTGASFELTATDIAELALAKAKPIAEARGVSLRRDDGADLSLQGRQANLACLILYNLLHNAVEASTPGQEVRLATRSEGDSVLFEVEDQGPGLPDSIKENLFQPCTSTKPGGTGMGLALSQQLARQAGGRIDLVRSSASGTCFQLVLGLEP